MSATTLDMIIDVVAAGANSIVRHTDEQLVPILAILDDAGTLELAAWMLDKPPTEESGTLVELLKQERAQAAAYVAEVSMVLMADGTDEMSVVDGAVVIAATPGETRVRMFIINRSKRIGKRTRFMEYLGADSGGLDHSWLERALEVAQA